MICSEKALGPFAATCIGAVPYASVLSRDLSRLSREAGYLCSIQASRLADLHFLPHTRAHDAIRPRTAFERDVPKSPSDQRAGRWPLMAHRVKSRQRSTSVAFGAKRTLTEPRLQNGIGHTLATSHLRRGDKSFEVG